MCDLFLVLSKKNVSGKNALSFSLNKKWLLKKILEMIVKPVEILVGFEPLILKIFHEI